MENNLPATGPLPEQRRLSDPIQRGLTTNRSSALTLVPCGAKTGNQLLASCLTLVAPTGMTADERRSWLAVARETLKGIPEDLLERGCEAARLHADHPAKIIPKIMREVGDAWERRRRIDREYPVVPRERRIAPPEPEKFDTKAILREFGLGGYTDGTGSGE
jgi:hypothetical protein